jgi:hypothetical protein
LESVGGRRFLKGKAMKGFGSRLRVLGALAFAAAAFNAMAQRKQDQLMSEAAGIFKPQASDGRFNYRGGPGTRSVKRAAQKRRNVIRHRKACRG